MPEKVAHPSARIRSQRPRSRGSTSTAGTRGAGLLAVAVALSLLAPLGGTACAREEADGPESARLARVLDLAPGMVVADVGAGDGEWTVELARRVGPGGRVYATEVREALLEEIRERAEEEGLANVTVSLGNQEATGLPAGCCDAILLRKVYHHFTDPAAMNESLFAALEPGGRLAVIEYRDFLSSRVQGVPENRSGHGLDPEILTLELEAAGFELERVIEEWPGEADEYCALYRRPAPRRRELPPGPPIEGFQQLLPRGGIPALVEPEFVPASEADLPEDAWVLGFVADGQAYAYDLNLLNHHEVVNHTAGGRPIAAVW